MGSPSATKSANAESLPFVQFVTFTEHKAILESLVKNVYVKYVTLHRYAVYDGLESNLTVAMLRGHVAPFHLHRCVLFATFLIDRRAVLCLCLSIVIAKEL